MNRLNFPHRIVSKSSFSMAFTASALSFYLSKICVRSHMCWFMPVILLLREEAEE